MMKKYIDRCDAGKVLSNLLKSYSDRDDVIVLALPRGGVPVAYEISTALAVPLDVIIVRKLGVPGYEELAMGAISIENTIFLNNEIINNLKISESAIQNVIDLEKEELHRREIVYRGKNIYPDFKNKIIILVDDGIATGASIQVAILALRKLKPKNIIIATPVAAFDTCQRLQSLVEQIICPLRPEDFIAVGVWYDDFPQTSDEEVCLLLEKANKTW